MGKKSMAAKEAKRQYLADARFTRPLVIKILNKTNVKNNDYFYLRKKLNSLKKKTSIKIHGAVVSFPEGDLVKINDEEYKISKIEKELFESKHIIKRYTLKYKLWITIHYINTKII